MISGWGKTDPNSEVASEQLQMVSQAPMYNTNNYVFILDVGSCWCPTWVYMPGYMEWNLVQKWEWNFVPMGCESTLHLKFWFRGGLQWRFWGTSGCWNWPRNLGGLGCDLIWKKRLLRVPRVASCLPGNLRCPWLDGRSHRGTVSEILSDNVCTWFCVKSV